MNFINGEELHLCCRLCLQRSRDLIDIFNFHCPMEPAQMSLSAKIMACLSIKVSPSSAEPKKICHKCFNSINAWYDYKISCDTANNTLQKYLQDLERNKPIQIPEKSSAPEDSLFPEISLFNYDSLLERSVSLGSNISSIVNYFLNSDKNKEKTEIDQIQPPKCNNFIEQIQRPNEFSDYQPAPASPPAENEIEINSKNKKKGYSCELCDDNFTHFSILLTHDESVHSTEVRKYSCTICKRLFILEDRLNTHMKLSHREKSFQCQICDKYFVSPKSLKVHCRLHSEMYKCEKCGFLSTSKISLNQHKQKHEGIKVFFTCDICQKKFSQNSSLRRHQNLHSENHGKCYECSICYLLFRSHSELIAHGSTHTGSISTDVYPCRMCDKNFKSKKVLTVHLQRHKEPQFSCTVCEKKLKSKYDLRIHSETHSDSKMFDCFHCHKKFSFKKTLVRHVKKHFPRIRSDVDSITIN